MGSLCDPCDALVTTTGAASAAVVAVEERIASGGSWNVLKSPQNRSSFVLVFGIHSFLLVPDPSALQALVPAPPLVVAVLVAPNLAPDLVLGARPSSSSATAPCPHQSNVPAAARRALDPVRIVDTAGIAPATDCCALAVHCPYL